jgi:hypothetical protein
MGTHYISSHGFRYCFEDDVKAVKSDYGYLPKWRRILLVVLATIFIILLFIML